MWLKRECPPHAANRALAQPGCAGHAARTPMRPVGWSRFKRSDNHCLDLSVIVRGTPSRGSSRRPSVPCCKKRRRHLPTVVSVTASSRGGLVAPPRCSTQDDACPQRQRLCGLGPTRPALQLVAFSARQCQGNQWSSQDHHARSLRTIRSSFLLYGSLTHAMLSVAIAEFETAAGTHRRGSALSPSMLSSGAELTLRDI